MTRPSRRPGPRFLAPECIQTSAMDCGPASLKCLLEGFGIPISYGRLREACQTEVDGTSIDTMEEVALQLGLEVEQNVIPADHLLLEEAKALPAIVVVVLPSGLTHFVVVWRKHGRFLQVMDPGTGRRFTTCERFLKEELYRHALPVSAEAWRDWAGSEEFLEPLTRRLKALKLSSRAIEALLAEACADESWRALAALDAATRMTDVLVRAGGVTPGGAATRVLENLFLQARKDPEGLIPKPYWSAYPAPPGEDGEEQIFLQGAVILRVRGLRGRAGAAEEEEEPPPLSPELVRALTEKPVSPWRSIWEMVRATSTLAPFALLAALFLAAGGLVVEALLFRGLLDLVQRLHLGEQRLGSAAALLIFTVALLLLELPIYAGLLRLGRQMEGRFRAAFLKKLPNISDRYFHSRLTSDMAERSHSVQVLRWLPTLAGHFWRGTFGLLLTTLGIAWLDPGSAPIALLISVVSVALPLLIQPVLTERDLRVRSHNAAISRFYLDALLGLVAVRTHGAERSLRNEHEGLLVEWVNSGHRLLRTSLWVEALEALVGFGLAAWLLFDHLARGGEAGGVLLLLYWALSLPAMGHEITTTARQYPGYRNVVLRLLEILSAPEENEEKEEVAGEANAALSPTPDTTPAPRSEIRIVAHEGEKKSQDKDLGVSISFEGVVVRAGGHTVLEEINLAIEPRSHIGIVGASGAGKSTLVGLLLGWHKPSSGRILVDGEVLEGPVLERLRQETAWVDPAVQLWNTSLLENLCYGITQDPSLPIGQMIDQADLRSVLERLPLGMQTTLGEGGALVSGGEGQRVRLARALLRPNVRLAILDEPFRGLDREKRRLLLKRARILWPKATLLCVTHDVGETRSFERVLVVENGRIIEDGVPDDLASRPDSRYRALLEAEELVRQKLWAGHAWRRVRLEGGQLFEEKRVSLASPSYSGRKAQEGK